MSEAAPETPAAETPAQAPEAPAKPETDWKAEARKWEQRAKEYKPAADKLAEIEEATKTAEQKAAERLAAAEAKAAEAERRAVRFEIAAEFALSSDDAKALEHVSSEDGMRVVAERLAAKAAQEKKQGNHVPREGSTSPATGGSDREAVRAIFGGS